MENSIFDRLIFDSKRKPYPAFQELIRNNKLHEKDRVATDIIRITFAALMGLKDFFIENIDMYCKPQNRELLKEALSSPEFDHGPGKSADISTGMLTEGYAFDTILDILLPNLYAILIVEMIGDAISKPISLTELLRKYYLALDETQQAKTLPKLFNDNWKCFFSIKQDGKGAQYQIGTPYQGLLAAIVQNFRISPLSTTESTRISYQYNKEFYSACIKSINNSTQSDLHLRTAQHYLLERVFRFNTKYTLFSGSLDYSGKEETLSNILADFFMSSPLVFFPDKFLLCQFYKPATEMELTLLDQATQTLHFLIQLSSYRFWLILDVLRDYIHIHSITYK